MDELYTVKNLKKRIDSGGMKEDYRWELFSQVFINEVSKAKMFVDCGAEHGFYTLLALKYGSSQLKVLAIEPDPPRFAALHKFFISDPRVTVLPYSLSNTTGITKLYKVPYTSATVDPNLSQLGEVDFTVLELETTLLDHQLLNQCPDIIKMDIEGAEVLAIEGGIQTLERCRPIIFLEWHPEYVQSVTPNGQETLLRIMNELDYSVLNHRGRKCDLAVGRVILSPEEKANSIGFLT